ncbi:MAG: hypothetical protein OEY97_05410 [Nitrospirota bacterium]|nr:hypothetical protein [Nitrospirota bacterium]
MFRKLHITSGAPVALAAAVLCAALLAATAAFAQQAGKVPKQQNRQVISGSVIDIIGTSEWPRGDTHIPWRDSEGFQGGPEVDYVQYLRREIGLPLDRESVRRRTDLERSAR